MNNSASCLRRFLIIAFTIAAAGSRTVLAADAPSGLTEIRWGATMAEIKRVFAGKPGVELAEEAPSHIVYNRGEFAGYPVERWELDIGPNGFWRGAVYLTAQPNSNRQFDDLAASLGKKYGKASPLPANGKAAGAKWNMSDPSTGHKDVYTVYLRYSWEPYEFVIRYSYDPSAGRASPVNPAVKGKKDL